MHLSSKGQFQYPTGTGKGNIQTRFISEAILKKPGFSVYIIVSPRIMLTNQLNERMTAELVRKHRITAKRLTVHSGKEEKFDDAESLVEFNGFLDILNEYQSAKSLNSDDIKDHLEEAMQHNVPVTIASTYQSLAAVTAALVKLQQSATVTLFDESHYTTRNDFWDFVVDHSAVSDKNFYFTATRKFTPGFDDGTGHNNTAFYGELLDHMSPAEAIEKGYIVRPRMQVVEVIHNKEVGLDAVIAIRGFDGHRSQIVSAQNAKLLVNCASTGQISDIIDSDVFKNWADLQKSTNPKFKWFAISSSRGALVDGKAVDRKTFLDELNRHKGDAIVFHIRILTEGIDVPDMTGVLFMDTVDMIRFLQTVGRSTRLHSKDRKAFESGLYKPEELDKMTKPYSWVIIPMVNKGAAVDEFAKIMHQYVANMRQYGFEAIDEITFDAWGQSDEDDEPTGMNENTNKSSMIEVVQQLGWLIEDETLATKLYSTDINDQVFVFDAMFARL